MVWSYILHQLRGRLGIGVVTKNLTGFVPIHSIEELCVLDSVVQVHRKTEENGVEISFLTSKLKSSSIIVVWGVMFTWLYWCHLEIDDDDWRRFEGLWLLGSSSRLETEAFCVETQGERPSQWWEQVSWKRHSCQQIACSPFFSAYWGKGTIGS